MSTHHPTPACWPWPGSAPSASSDSRLGLQQAASNEQRRHETHLVRARPPPGRGAALRRRHGRRFLHVRAGYRALDRGDRPRPPPTLQSARTSPVRTRALAARQDPAVGRRAAARAACRRAAYRAGAPRGPRARRHRRPALARAERRRGRCMSVTDVTARIQQIQSQLAMLQPVTVDRSGGLQQRAVRASARPTASPPPATDPA